MNNDTEKIRTTIIVHGKVQMADYRGKVIYAANKFGLEGLVGNLMDGTVEIIVEGGKGDIEQFYKDIDIKNSLINVIKRERNDGLYAGEYEGKGFRKIVDEGETDQRLDTAADLLKKLIDVTKGGFGELGGKIDGMLEKQDKMLEKQDKMLEKQDETIEEIKNLRYDLKSYLDDRFNKIEKDVSRIKAKIKMAN